MLSYTAIDSTVRYLQSIGFRLYQRIDKQEAREHLGDELDDGVYAVIGQTDTATTYALHEEDPQVAEIVACAHGQHPEVVGFLRAIGWREVPDSYIQTHAFYVP